MLPSRAVAGNLPMCQVSPLVIFFFFRTVEHNTETRHFFPPQVSFIRRRQGLLRVTGMDGETDGRMNRQNQCHHRGQTEPHFAFSVASLHL